MTGSLFPVLAQAAEGAAALPPMLQRPDSRGAIALLTYVRAELKDDDTAGPRWKIEGSPLVVVGAMKTLSGALSRRREAVSFPATQSNFEDLLMLMHRYPVRIDERPALQQELRP